MSSKKIVYKTEESVEVITGKKTEGAERKVKLIKPPFIREVEKYGNLKKKAKKDMTENLKV